VKAGHSPAQRTHSRSAALDDPDQSGRQTQHGRTHNRGH
jgi:hypothetical protein